jgi:hypothetical protein
VGVFVADSNGRKSWPLSIRQPTSIGMGGRLQSECPADIIGIRTHAPDVGSIHGFRYD